MATTTPQRRSRYKALSVGLAPLPACAAVTHSRRLRRVRQSRPSVRTTASAMSQAWSASMVMARNVCDRATKMSRPTARRWLRLEIPDRRGRRLSTTGIKAGTATAPTSRPVQRSAETAGKIQAATAADKRRRRNQAAAEVVHHLPAALDGNAGFLPPRGVARDPQDPRQELPVAPHPSMVAAGGHLVVGGELLEQIHVGQQPCAREHALEEIVAEERALRDLPFRAISKRSTS
jgi:hypothetical protein